jgi:hypothetical protein
MARQENHPPCLKREERIKCGCDYSRSKIKTAKNIHPTTSVAFSDDEPNFLNFDCPVAAKARKKQAHSMSETSMTQRNKYIFFPVIYEPITKLALTRCNLQALETRPQTLRSRRHLLVTIVCEAICCSAHALSEKLCTMRVVGGRSNANHP